MIQQLVVCVGRAMYARSCEALVDVFVPIACAAFEPVAVSHLGVVAGEDEGYQHPGIACAEAHSVVCVFMSVVVVWLWWCKFVCSGAHVLYSRDSLP